LVNYKAINTFPVIKTLNLVSKNAFIEWLAEDVSITFSKPSSRQMGTTLVYDYTFPESGVVEYTLDGGVTWHAIKENTNQTGSQNKFIRIADGIPVDPILLNFRCSVNITNLIFVLGEL